MRTRPNLPYLAISALVTLPSVAQPSLAPPPGAPAQSARFGHLIELTQSATPGDADAVFKITQPGSYVLTQNITVPAGSAGIEVAASDVTIDLNGYTIEGAPGQASPFGIATATPDPTFPLFHRIVIRNGNITGFDTGVSMSRFDLTDPPFPSSAAESVHLEALRVAGARVGINFGSDARVTDTEVIASEIAIDGLDTVVDACRIRLTGTGTAVVGTRLDVRDSSLEIAGNGSFGISTSTSIIESCIVRMISAQGGFGITASDSLVRDCHVIGASASTGNTGYQVNGNIHGCSAARMDTGFIILPGAGTLIRGCNALITNTPLIDNTGLPGSLTSIDNSF